jgi:hypothetical protein
MTAYRLLFCACQARVISADGVGSQAHFTIRLCVKVVSGYFVGSIAMDHNGDGRAMVNHTLLLWFYSAEVVVIGTSEITGARGRHIFPSKGGGATAL